MRGTPGRISRRLPQPGGSGLWGSSAEQIPTRYNGIRTNEAIYGTTIPILMGQNRISWKLLWYGDFKSQTAQQPGGSGLSKSGTQYVYFASVLGLVCQGSCSNILGVWDSSGKFQVDGASEPFVIPSSPANPTYTVANSTIYAQDTGVAKEASYSVTANDYGSTGTIVYSGTQMIPLTYVATGAGSGAAGAPGKGQYSTNPATGVYTFSSADNGSTVYINYSFYRYYIIENETTTVPAVSPYKVAVNNQPYFQKDDGVTFYPGGIALTAVSGTPTTTGTYNPNGGNYIFAAVDANKGVTINYEYKDVNTDANAPNTLNLTFLNGALGQEPWAYLTTNFPGSELGYSGICCIASSSLYLGYTAMLPQYNFEVAGLYQFGGGIVDACPSDCIQGALSDPAFGVGLAPGYIQLGRTINYLLWSQEVGTAPWLTDSGGTSVVENNATAPDSTMTAATVTANRANGDRYQFAYGATTPNNSPWTFSIYLKVATGTQPVKLLIDRSGFDVLVGPTITVTTSWTRYSLTHPANWTGSNGAVLGGFYIVNNEASVLVWGAQLEVGSIANPYVATTSTTSAEVTGAGLQGVLRDYWCANSFFISPLLDGQTSAASTVGDWLEAGQAYCFWSEGLLKFTPLGDTTAVANGYTFSPPTNPIVSLDDDDFVGKAGEDPIKITRSPWQNRWNDVRVEWDVRTNDYNTDVLESSDAASIQTYGLMREEPKSWRFICNETSAQWAANLRLQRLINVTNKYEFMIKDFYWFLEPGDIIEISDGVVGGAVGPLGLNQAPVRLLKLEYGTDGIKCEAENYPYSIATAVIYAKQGQLPSAVLDVAQQDPGDASILIFEAPNRLAQYKGNILYILANGQNVNWGGCDVWISYNGTDYNQYATIHTPGRIGVLAEPLPAYASLNPDIVDTLAVNMTQSGAQLISVTPPDAASYVTLCGIVNAERQLELISFETATLTGVNQYSLTTLFRGVYQTEPMAHLAGEQFARLDQSATTYQYDSTYYGKTIYFKFTSFNLYGNQEQTLAEVPAYSFVLQGVGPGAIDLDTGLLNPASNPSTYNGAWNSTTAYVLGNQVSYSGGYYICIQDNIDAEPNVNPTDWVLISTVSLNSNPDLFLGAWSGIDSYVPGNQVTYSNGYYICLANNTNEEPDVNPAYWSLISTLATEQLMGVYSNATSYVSGNQVLESGLYYICISSTTGNAPSGTSSYWTEIGEQPIFITIYSGSTSYPAGVQVSYNSNYYTCILATTGNLPTNKTYWTWVFGTWNSSLAFVPGNEVLYNGGYYSCVTANTNQTPSSNPTYWLLFGQAAIFLGPWNGSVAYKVNSMVTYDGNFYLCIIANTGQQPLVATTYWELMGPDTLDNIQNGTIYIHNTAYVASTSIVIPNNFFESSTTLPPPGWIGGAGTTLSYNTTTPQTGTQSLVIHTTAQFQGATCTQKWQVFAGDAYLVSGYVKSDGTGIPEIQLAFYNAAGAYIGGAQATGTNSTAWTYVSGTGTVPAGGTSAVLILQNNSTSASSVQFDEIYAWRCITLDAEVQDGDERFAATAADLTYRPLTNPLSSVDSGTYATVDIVAFTMRTSSKGDISLNSGAISPLSYNTLYYIYYSDPALAGGSVTYQATITKETALFGSGVFFVGSIITPVQGGLATVGNNDGGTGAQQGIVYKLSLSTFSPFTADPTFLTGCNATDQFSYSGGGASASITHPEYATAGNSSNYCAMNATGSATNTVACQVVLYGPGGSVTQNFQAIELVITYQIVFHTGGGGDGVLVNAGILTPQSGGFPAFGPFNNGEGIIVLVDPSPGGIVTQQFSIPPTQSLTDFCVIFQVGADLNNSIAVRLYEIYLSCLA